MTPAFDISLLSLAAVYAGFLLWCTAGWRRAEPGLLGARRTRPESAVSPEVSIVIPARNEEAGIARCVRSVLLSATTARSEIIVVDDRSDDDTTGVLLQTFGAEVEAGVLRVVRLHADEPGGGAGGKQRALLEGVRAARGEFVLTTDADCTVARGWVEAMTTPLSHEGGGGADIVAGPVTCELSDGASAFERLQALELVGLVAIGGGSMANGYPTICNSANLGYRRTVFLDWHQRFVAKPTVSATAVPGLDETIVLQARRLTGRPARFVKSRSALVRARPNRTLGQFVRQRIRWASMGGRYPDRGIVALSVLFFSYFVMLLLGPTLTSTPVWLAAVGIKIAADALLVSTAVGFFHGRSLLSLAPFGTVMHVPYIVGVALCGVLSPGAWKPSAAPGDPK